MNVYNNINKTTNSINKYYSLQTNMLKFHCICPTCLADPGTLVLNSYVPACVAGGSGTPGDGVVLGSASDSRSVTLVSPGSLMNGISMLGIVGTGIASQAFLYTGATTTQSSSTWIMACTHSSSIKMVMLRVSVSGGSAYVCAAQAGSFASASALTSAVVNAAWASKTTGYSIATSSTSPSTNAYGVSVVAYTGVTGELYI